MLVKKRSIGIVSYCNFVRTYASVNHQFYSENHGYTYIYDISPTRNDVFKNKIEKILKLIDLFDWVFWIDDDAFFTKYSTPLTPFIDNSPPKAELIFCTSPVNEGKKTYLSSGNFFLKSTKHVKEFLQACLDADLENTRYRWDDEKFGHFTNGDQDIMVDLLMNDARFNSRSFHAILPFGYFNTRPFHFEKNYDEHFLVHFTGNNKQDQVIAFANKFNLSPALIPKESFDKYFGIYNITDKQNLPKTHML